MLEERDAALLVEGSLALGVALDAVAVRKIGIYLDELRAWTQAAVRLVSRSDARFLIRKHFLDSLAVLPLVARGARVVDLGSGAGFPGLVLALAEPSLAVTLIEARRKKVSFLRQVVRATQAQNVRAICGRAESLGADEAFRGNFDVAVTRATWAIADFLALAAPFLSPGGLALAMKGPAVERELVELAREGLAGGFRLGRRHSYTLPLGNERREALIFDRKGFT